MISISKQARTYQKFAERRRNAHQMLLSKVRFRHILLSLFMAFIAGVAIVASIYKSATSVEIVSTGFLSIIALALTTFLSFARFSKISEQHQQAVKAYEANRLDLDRFLSANVNLETTVPQEALARFKEIIIDLKKVVQTTPRVPEEI
jgi:ABC-type transport system involved in cytochrome bd biosynthesis fused ATPase/permease subunit